VGDRSHQERGREQRREASRPGAEVAHGFPRRFRSVAGASPGYRRNGDANCAPRHHRGSRRPNRPWRRVAGAVLPALCASLAAALPAAAQPAQSIRVHGLEFEAKAERERLLIFADAPIEPRSETPDRGTLVIELDGGELDPSTPKRIAPETAGTVQSVTVVQRSGGVRVVIRRRPGADPEISRRGSIIAVDLPGAGPRERVGTIRLDFRNVPLEALVTRFAREAGERFLMDGDLPNRITLIGPDAVTPDEAIALLDTALLFHGYAAVPMPGGGRKIVPIAGAPLPWRAELPDETSDAPVTTLVRLESIRAEPMLEAVRPLLGSHTVGVAHAPSNAILLAGSERRIERLRDAIRVLDERGVEHTVVWRLRHRSTQELMPLFEGVFDAREMPVVQEDPSGTALVLRVRARDVDRARALLARLDRPPVGSGELHVIPLSYADPDQLAGELRALQSGEVGARAAVDALAGADFAIAVDGPTHSLVLRAEPAVARIIADVVAQLDVEPRSVMVSVTIIEVETGNELALGFDYLLPLTDPKGPEDLIVALIGDPTGNLRRSAAGADVSVLGRFTRSLFVLPVVDPVTGIVIPLNIGDNYVVTANERDIYARTLLRPRLLVMNGEEQELFVGDNVPVPVSQSDATNPLETRQDIERHDTGMRLNVIPTISGYDSVQLDLELEVSRISESLAGAADDVGPSFSERTLSARVRVGYDEMAVIGMASEPRTFRTVTGIPWLKDLPVIGFLARSTVEQERNVTLIVMAGAEVPSRETTLLNEALVGLLAQADVAASAD
jgi:general secretion pathway protein D